MGKEKRKSPSISFHEITNQFLPPLWNEKPINDIDTFFSSTHKIEERFLKSQESESFKKSVFQACDAFPNLEMNIEDVIPMAINYY